MYILDTNTLIYFFKGKGQIAKNLFATYPKDIAIPSIVLYELEVGIAKSSFPQKRTKQLQNLTNIINILPFGYDEARIAAAIRTKLEKSGTPIGPYDILIAAIAVSNRSTLVTHNIKEFNRIKNLDLVDWY
ncbi:MAG: type II toxin-antitoxin system VapC family toxin [Pseudomonadota bacterium]